MDIVNIFSFATKSTRFCFPVFCQVSPMWSLVAQTSISHGVIDICSQEMTWSAWISRFVSIHFSWKCLLWELAWLRVYSCYASCFSSAIVFIFFVNTCDAFHVCSFRGCLGVSETSSTIRRVLVILLLTTMFIGGQIELKIRKWLDYELFPSVIPCIAVIQCLPTHSNAKLTSWYFVIKFCLNYINYLTFEFTLGELRTSSDSLSGKYQFKFLKRNLDYTKI